MINHYLFEIEYMYHWGNGYTHLPYHLFGDCMGSTNGDGCGQVLAIYHRYNELKPINQNELKNIYHNDNGDGSSYLGFNEI